MISFSGMLLMTFGLLQSEVSGWNKPVIIATLLLSCVISPIPESTALYQHSTVSLRC